MNRKKLESGDIKCPDCGKKCKPINIEVAKAKVKDRKTAGKLVKMMKKEKR